MLRFGLKQDGCIDKSIATDTILVYMEAINTAGDKIGNDDSIQEMKQDVLRLIEIIKRI